MSISKTDISAAAIIFDDIDIAMIIATVRGSEKYKNNPAFYSDLETKIDDADGGVQAQQINAAMAAISALGIGVVEIDQRRVSGSDGLYYSQLNTRNNLIEYIIGVLYPEYFESVTVDSSIGNGYLVAQRGDV